MTTSCLACGCSDTRQILDFGPQAAANLLSERPNQQTDKVKLALRFCDHCGHAQQDTFFPPARLFGHYLYQSGTTRTLREYFEWLANGVGSVVSSQDRVLELASNDGSFLEALAAAGISATGIEPASNLVEISRARGHEVVEGYWPLTAVPEKFRCVIGMNVLAHGPDPLTFLRASREALKPDGIACMQVSQADMFANFEFDTLYHEHYSFFCANSLRALAERAGFTRSAFCKVAIHGGSIMAVFGFESSPVEPMAQALVLGGFALGRLESSMRPSLATANAFSQSALQTCRSIASLERMAREGARRFVLVGAAAKAITVLQASGVTFDAVLDEAPLKIGRYIPGTSMRIISFDEVTALEQPCLFLIGAWNFRSEIEAKLRTLRRSRHHDLTAVYFPSLIIADLG